MINDKMSSVALVRRMDYHYCSDLIAVFFLSATLSEFPFFSDTSGRIGYTRYRYE